MIIAILDHEEHQLFIECVEDTEIVNKYNGQEEAYIMDKYEYTDPGQFSWEYITKRVEVFGTDTLSVHYN